MAIYTELLKINNIWSDYTLDHLSKKLEDNRGSTLATFEIDNSILKMCERMSDGINKDYFAGGGDGRGGYCSPSDFLKKLIERNEDEFDDIEGIFRSEMEIELENEKKNEENEND